MDRTVGIKALKTTLGKVWHISKPTTFTIVRRNIFTITFAIEIDKYKVLYGRPWSFNHHLLVLKQLDTLTPPAKIQFEMEMFWVQLFNLSITCMKWFYGVQISRYLEEVHEVYVDHDDTGWGRCLRVKVDLPINKILVRGQYINIKGKKFWICMKYEKLPKFCFNCGKITHSTTCIFPSASNSHPQFGVWLKVESIWHGMAGAWVSSTDDENLQTPVQNPSSSTDLYPPGEHEGQSIIPWVQSNYPTDVGDIPQTLKPGSTPEMPTNPTNPSSRTTKGTMGSEEEDVPINFP